MEGARHSTPEKVRLSSKLTKRHSKRPSAKLSSSCMPGESSASPLLHTQSTSSAATSNRLQPATCCNQQQIAAVGSMFAIVKI